ncbi:MAG TPA: flagellar biosynthesis anti-sigma factor FlgM [Nitrosomonas sp.]|nr:flagellar biosynthesis anti-sigma factor FlgM [Nitrosomonas sp.]
MHLSAELEDPQSNVHLSSTLSSLGDTTAANISKIAEIKQAMAEGRFKVNPEVVADRLLETVKELIQSNKKA